MHSFWRSWSKNSYKLTSLIWQYLIIGFQKHFALLFKFYTMHFQKLKKKCYCNMWMTQHSSPCFECSWFLHMCSSHALYNFVLSLECTWMLSSLPGFFSRCDSCFSGGASGDWTYLRTRSFSSTGGFRLWYYKSPFSAHKNFTCSHPSLPKNSISKGMQCNAIDRSINFGLSYIILYHNYVYYLNA